jgi:hypothetical protein
LLYGVRGRNEKCLQNFCCNTSREEATLKLSGYNVRVRGVLELQVAVRGEAFGYMNLEKKKYA